MFKIGELASLYNVSGDTLRFYEKNGLLSPSKRSESGYRLYSNQDRDRLDFILQAKSVGFTLSEIAELLFIDINKNNKTCHDAKQIVNKKLYQVQAKLVELQRFEKALQSLSDSCIGDATSAVHCTILESLESKVSLQNYEQL